MPAARRVTKGARPTAAAASPAASSPAPDPFVLGSEGDHPVDLSRDLEVRAADGDAHRALRADLRSRALRAPSEEAATLLQHLERQLAEGQLRLPPMPQVVLRAQRLIDSPDCSLAALGAEIGTDPALATKIIGIANSPFYAGMEPVDGVRDALTRLGLREARNILLAIGMRSRVFRVPGFDDSVHALWQHALASSLTTQALAAEVGCDPDRGFLAGLVHDIGRIAILTAAADLDRASRGGSTARAAAIERASDEFHARVGGVVAESWHLASEVVAAITYQDRPERASDEPSRCFARVVRGGDLLARRICDEPSEAELASIAGPLGLEPCGILAALEDARSGYETIAKIL